MNRYFTDIIKNKIRWQKRLLEYQFMRNNDLIASKTYSETILIASMGRSGSTWLSEIINFSSGYREIFEPFKAQKVPEAELFKYPIFLDEDFKSAIHFSAAKKILRGGFTNPWTDIVNYKKIPDKLLIKDILANFILRWLYVNFPKTKIILLIRHPYTCVESWLRCNFSDGSLEKKFMLENKEIQSHLPSGAIDYLKKTKNAFERVVFFWCAYYFIPLKSFKKDELLPVFYEDIRYKPKIEVKRIYDYLSIDIPSSIYEAINKPSMTATRKEYKKEKSNTTDTKKIEFINNTMKLFGMESLYADINSPNRDGLNNLMNI